VKRTNVRALGAAALLLTSIAVGEESTNSENNQDGSLNTNTVDSTVSSNNNSTDHSTSNTYNGAGSSSDMPVGSAIAPSYMSNGIETCLQGTGSSIQTGIVGYTSGNYKVDDYCNRRRNAKVLSDLGMKVAAISVMCADEAVFRAMFVSGTPCPVIKGGRLVVGRRAFLLMKMQPSVYIPDYGEVRFRKSATFSKKPPVKIYSDTQKWYNSILGIGAEHETEEVADSDPSQSVSDKFRHKK
jgi:hypothetical protein